MLLKIKDFIYFKDEENQSAYIYSRKENAIKSVIPVAILGEFEKNLGCIQDEFKLIDDLDDLTLYEPGLFYDYDCYVDDKIRLKCKITNKYFELDKEIAINELEKVLKKLYEEIEWDIEDEKIHY